MGTEPDEKPTPAPPQRRFEITFMDQHCDRRIAGETQTLAGAQTLAKLFKGRNHARYMQIYDRRMDRMYRGPADED